MVQDCLAVNKKREKKRSKPLLRPSQHRCQLPTLPRKTRSSQTMAFRNRPQNRSPSPRLRRLLQLRQKRRDPPPHHPRRLRPHRIQLQPPHLRSTLRQQTLRPILRRPRNRRRPSLLPRRSPRYPRPRQSCPPPRYVRRVPTGQRPPRSALAHDHPTPGVHRMRRMFRRGRMAGIRGG